jgi:hypothetical protein
MVHRSEMTVSNRFGMHKNMNCKWVQKIVEGFQTLFCHFRVIVVRKAYNSFFWTVSTSCFHPSVCPSTEPSTEINIYIIDIYWLISAEVGVNIISLAV